MNFNTQEDYLKNLFFEEGNDFEFQHSIAFNNSNYLSSEEGNFNPQDSSHHSIFYNDNYLSENYCNPIIQMRFDSQGQRQYPVSQPLFMQQNSGQYQQQQSREHENKSCGNLYCENPINMGDQPIFSKPNQISEQQQSNIYYQEKFLDIRVPNANGYSTLSSVGANLNRLTYPLLEEQLSNNYQGHSQIQEGREDSFHLKQSKIENTKQTDQPSIHDNQTKFSQPDLSWKNSQFNQKTYINPTKENILYKQTYPQQEKPSLQYTYPQIDIPSYQQQQLHQSQINTTAPLLLQQQNQYVPLYDGNNDQSSYSNQQKQQISQPPQIQQPQNNQGAIQQQVYNPSKSQQQQQQYTEQSYKQPQQILLQHQPSLDFEGQRGYISQNQLPTLSETQIYSKENINTYSNLVNQQYQPEYAPDIKLEDDELPSLNQEQITFQQTGFIQNSEDCQYIQQLPFQQFGDSSQTQLQESQLPTSNFNQLFPLQQNKKPSAIQNSLKTPIRLQFLDNQKGKKHIIPTFLKKKSVNSQESLIKYEKKVKKSSSTNKGLKISLNAEYKIEKKIEMINETEKLQNHSPEEIKAEANIKFNYEQEIIEQKWKYHCCKAVNEEDSYSRQNGIKNEEKDKESQMYYSQGQLGGVWEESHEERGKNTEADEINILAESIKHCNKKNVVKNIMSAFLTYMNDSSFKYYAEEEQKCIPLLYHSSPTSSLADEDLRIDEIRKKFKRYLSQKSLNHYSVRLLILHNNYGPIFRYYLTGPIKTWIHNSKVVDLSAHTKMIGFFLACFQDNSVLNELKRHEKKRAHFS